MAPAHRAIRHFNQQPWFGFFAGHKGSQSVFGVSSDGSMVYNHNNELPSVISGHPHRIYANVEETLPDGQTRIRRLDPETLETTDEPTDKPGKVSYRGKVACGATIEAGIEFDWLGGRRITFSAGSGSLMTLSDKDNTPIYKNGFNFNWMPDPAKDPKGGAKLTISTR